MTLHGNAFYLPQRIHAGFVRVYSPFLMVIVVNENTAAVAVSMKHTGTVLRYLDDHSLADKTRSSFSRSNNCVVMNYINIIVLLCQMHFLLSSKLRDAQTSWLWPSKKKTVNIPCSCKINGYIHATLTKNWSACNYIYYKHVLVM